MTEINTETHVVVIKSPPASTGQLDGSKPQLKMVNKPKKRLLYLDWIRFSAIFMVVIVHAGQNVPKPSDMPKYLDERMLGFMKVLCQFGVTTFFYCGGRVQSLKRVSYSKFISARFKRVLLPLLFAIPLVLHPAQYLACSNGLEAAHCEFIWPEQNEPVTYLAFLQHWASLGIYSFSKMHWLWFLPTMFLTDALNFAPTRWMKFYFHGGWIDTELGSKDESSLVKCLYDSFSGEFLVAMHKRPDVATASFILGFYFTAAVIFMPQLLCFFLAYWIAMILVFVGLVCLRETKRYEVWWVTNKIIPILSLLYSLFWIQEGGGASAVLNITMFTLFGVQGYLEELVAPFIEMNCKNGGKALKPANFFLTVFLTGLCAPTSGTDEEYYKVPMFRMEPWLAVLATLGNWVAIWCLNRFSYAYMNEECSHFQYFHLTQSAMIVYIFHMLFLVIAIVFVLPDGIGYVFRFSVVVSFVYLVCGALYALLLQYSVTRSIFGLREDKVVKQSVLTGSVQEVV